MVVTDVYNHRFHKIFQMDEGLNHIMPKDDIFVWVKWEDAMMQIILQNIHFGFRI